MKKVFVAVCLFVVILSMSLVGFSQIPSITREAFLSGLSSPIHITNAGDGTNRMFVLEQRGLIKVVQPGATTTTDFMDLSSIVSQTGNERGLLGIAFHPDFENNSFFYVNYTRTNGDSTITEIERYKATNNNSTGDINSAFPIITINQDFSNHNGGHIEFGPDGNLYIGMGDGGSGNDPNNRAQNINSLLGKMLRITPSISETVGSTPYTVPADNPFVGVAGADEIFAIGLRNPYRWSFDRGGTNQLWTGDVGQFSIEEVTIVENGGNYGWRVFEGNNCTNNDPNDCDASNFDAPEFQYDHSQGRCSITGGYVYRGTEGTLPLGAYVYGDFCSGQYYYWDGTSQILIENTQGARNISSFGQDEAGELYLVHRGGTVEKIVNSESFVPNSTSADFDGDGKTDKTVFRPSDGVWYSLGSIQGAFSAFQFGLDGDIPTPEDFDGDAKTDIAVFRPSSGFWYQLRSEDSTFFSQPFGLDGDIPTAGDYDGDGKADITVFRPSNGFWYSFRSEDSSVNSQPFGLSGDIPTPGDFDGDGKYDIAVWRPDVGNWYRLDSSTGGFVSFHWGQDGDVPVPGDFDNDGKNDYGVWRPSNGFWYIFNTADNSTQSRQWGDPDDIPVAGDYDGDGADDIAVWRPNNGFWYVIQSSDSVETFTPFGSNGDLPAPSYDAP